MTRTNKMKFIVIILKRKWKQEDWDASLHSKDQPAEYFHQGIMQKQTWKVHKDCVWKKRNGPSEGLLKSKSIQMTCMQQWIIKITTPLKYRINF